MNYTRKFSELGRGDAGIAGGKGASLGEMTRAGIPVPQGFVVTAEAFEYFLRESELHQQIDSILHSVNTHDVVSVERASEEIHALILSASIPENLIAEIVSGFAGLDTQFVAVRSSATAEDGATAAWAGQLESFLNTEKSGLLDNVRRCWASLFTPRAIVYRFEKNLHEVHISVAVVVQKMVASEVSGIAFSVHPVTEDYNQMIIEAGLGLGEAIVSGQITPDSYIVEKSPRRVVEKNISSQTRALYRAAGGGNEWRDVCGSAQKLHEAEILELAEIVVCIESHYNFPCDIEWAREEGKFYIVQSRPITTLQHKTENKVSSDFEFEYQREAPISMFHIWALGHVRAYEILGLDGWLAWRVYAEYDHGIWKAYSQKNNLLKIKDAIHAMPETVVGGLINNYIADFETLQQNLNLCTDKIFIKQLIAGFIITFVTGDLPNHALSIAALHAREKTERLFYVIWDALKARTADPDHFDLYSYDELVQGPALDEAVLQKRLMSRLSVDGVEPAGATPRTRDVFYKGYVRDLTLLLQEGWDAGNTHGVPQLLGIEEYPRPTYAYYACDGVVELWENEQAYGWMHDRIAERIRTDISFFESVCNTYETMLDEITALGQQSFSSADEFKIFLNTIEKYVAHFLVIYAGVLNEGMPDRVRELSQRMRDNDSMLYDCDKIIRRALRDLYNVPEDLAVYVVGDDLNDSVSPQQLRERSGGFGWMPGKLRDAMSFEKFVAVNTDEYIFETDSIESHHQVTGQVAYRGKVTGRVKIVKRKNQVGDVEVGDIIVSPMTTPDFVPAMKKAAAFVTEEGGITCHAAIIAREMHKPCVIGTRFATEVFKDGDLVEVDADNGIVKKI